MVDDSLLTEDCYYRHDRKRVEISEGGLLSCSRLFAFNALIYPRKYQVGQLKVVLILHQHVAVSFDAQLGQMH
jgi:hypothetical protein